MLLAFETDAPATFLDRIRLWLLVLECTLSTIIMTYFHPNLFFAHFLP
jgi:hypothetical protein